MRTICHPNTIWWGAVIMKLLLIQASSSYCSFFSFRTRFILRNTLSPCSSLNVRNQVLHPYKLYLKYVNYCSPCNSSGLTLVDRMSSMKFRRPSNRKYGLLVIYFRLKRKAKYNALLRQNTIGTMFRFTRK
jgi:hypothetical protein